MSTFADEIKTTHPQSTPLLVLVRRPLSKFGPCAFSALWGLSLSQAKAAPNVARERLWIIARGWLAASLVRSLFNAFSRFGISRMAAKGALAAPISSIGRTNRRPVRSVR